MVEIIYIFAVKVFLNAFGLLIASFFRFVVPTSTKDVVFALSFDFPARNLKESLVKQFFGSQISLFEESSSYLMPFSYIASHF